MADTYLGRFNTIYGSSLLYVVGVLLLSVVSITDDMLKTVFDKTARLVYFVLALVLIAFSAGGIKANVSPFGADQVEQDGPRAVQTFFNWFYWFINTGALVAFTVVVGVQQSDVFSGYAITAGSMFLGIVAFLACRNKYVSNPPRGSQLTETAKIICEAIQNRKRNPGSWLDGAKSTFGGNFTDAQVEDVKAVLRVLPVFIMFCFYFTVYSQVGLFYNDMSCKLFYNCLRIISKRNHTHLFKCHSLSRPYSKNSNPIYSNITQCCCKSEIIIIHINRALSLWLKT